MGKKTVLPVKELVDVDVEHVLEVVILEPTLELIHRVPYDRHEKSLVTQHTPATIIILFKNVTLRRPLTETHRGSIWREEQKRRNHRVP